MHGYQGHECHSGINNKGESWAGKKKRKIPRCQKQIWEWKPEWLVIRQPGQSGGGRDLTQISPHHQESWMWQHTERENVAWAHWKRGWGLRSYIKATSPVKRRLVHRRSHTSRAPGAERQGKESWADARPWPSCPDIRLPIRSSRKIGGFVSEVMVNPILTLTWWTASWIHGPGLTPEHVQPVDWDCVSQGFPLRIHKTEKWELLSLRRPRKNGLMPFVWLHISLKPQVFLSDCIASLYWNPKATKWWQVFQCSRVTALWFIFPVSRAHFWEAQRLVKASETTQRCWWRQGWDVRPETRNLEGGLLQEG